MFGHGVDWNVGEDRRCRRVGKAHNQQTAAPPFAAGFGLRKFE